jgi:tetraacyldisaccharide 4'-kinase
VFDEGELQGIWYGGGKPGIVQRGLAIPFGIAGAVRRGLYAAGLLRRVRLPVPVIVVGNITAGGTGKTPLVIALVEVLRARGRKPGVISRGYGGSARAAMRVDVHSDPLVVGDEARLIFDTTGAPVAVGRDRVAAGRTLLASADVDVLIADDGLQHYRLQRDVEICVIDGERRFGNGLLLPAGPLREPITRLGSVDFRVCNGGELQTGEIPMTLFGDAATALDDVSAARPLREFAGQRVHAVAGIGNPRRFFAQLRAAGIDVIEHPFGDHHAYAAKDLDFSDKLPILMTQKDAVKCRVFAPENCWFVPVRARLPVALTDSLLERLRDRPSDG